MRRLWLCLLVVFGLASAAYAEPPNTHEILSERPSGFWTSNRPAIGGAYRYRLMGIGIAVLIATGWLTYRVVKRGAEKT